MAYLGLFKQHWKKITFFSCPIGYGLYYLKTQYEISKHMRLICNEINCNPSRLGTQPKNVLVIINPVANKKKAEKLFRKYCEPILHLAGYSVDIVKTDHVGHAKSLIESKNLLPDAVVVAGGDGTSSEVVTGLMRRNDATCPLVLLPLGYKSETAFKYVSLKPKKNRVEYVKSLTNSILPMINDSVHEENVIRYDVIDENTSDQERSKQPKSVYGLNGFSWGLLRDIDATKDKYWYFGPLKYYAASLINSFSNSINWKFSTDFVYTPPCPGCRDCSIKQTRNISKLYLNKLLSVRPQESRLSKQDISNEECNTKIKGHTEANQLYIGCKQNDKQFPELESEFISSLNPGIEFVKIIPKVVKNEIAPSLVLKCRTIQLLPMVNKDTPSFYYIDGEEYDVRPIKIQLIPNAIKIYKK